MLNAPVNRRVAFGCLVVLAAAVVPATREVSRRFLFRTDRVSEITTPTDAEIVTTIARDGVVVHALEMPARPGQRVVVHFHNNSETMSGPIAMARALHAHGLGVVIVEYRGYGVSRATQSPSEAGVYRDAEAALDWLAARGIGADRIVLSGTSLGSGVAAEMARRGRGTALVLISPYTSIPDLVTDRVPFAPARLLLADRFETLAKARDIHVPTVVIHGSDDDVVPFWMGARVASAIRDARFVPVQDGRHGDGDLFARDEARLVGEVLRVARAGDQGNAAL